VPTAANAALRKDQSPAKRILRASSRRQPTS
jgi:hypothetical protein